MMLTDLDAEVAFSAAFLGDVIERVGDLLELKLVLQLGRLATRRGTPMVPLSDLEEPVCASQILGAGSPRPSLERLSRVLDRAVADAVILRVTVHEQDASIVWIGLATREAYKFVDRVRAGEAGAEIALALSAGAGVAIDRPNIFALYERLIGPLTPLVAEELRDAERVYPIRWIEDAMSSAVDYNKRNWRYVQAILRGWEEAGTPNAIPRRHT